MKKLKKLEIKKVMLQDLETPILNEVAAGNLAGPTYVVGGRCGSTAGPQGCSVVVTCFVQTPPK